MQCLLRDEEACRALLGNEDGEDCQNDGVPWVPTQDLVPKKKQIIKLLEDQALPKNVTLDLNASLTDSL